jgi:predicted TIM-barrel fold metal-dependent hydrolase
VADLEFTDTHVHFWDLDEPNLHYAWLDPDGPPQPIGLDDYRAIKSARYWADDFIAETRFANVTRVVHVQAAVGTSDPVEETRWLQQFVERLGIPHGIVAFVDLALPDAESVLERHAQFGNLRGIRSQHRGDHDRREDDVAYVTDEAWQRGYALLERFGLVYCDAPLVEWMGHTAELARRFPGITHCIDHAGFPRRRDQEYFEAWRSGMQKLASVENTVVKISGLGMRDHSFTVDSLRPWVLECIEAWGVERSFFGTNWPVDRLFSSYGDVLDVYRELISDFTKPEQIALFSGNANRVFRLDE